MKSIRLLMVFAGVIISSCQNNTSKKKENIVPDEVMEEIYKEIRTPFKYGVVFAFAFCCHPQGKQAVSVDLVLPIFKLLNGMVFEEFKTGFKPGMEGQISS